MATVHIEGIPFELGDAADFAKRLDLASAGTSRPGLSPAHALAIEIDEAVKVGGRAVEVPDEARQIAIGVLNDWYPSAPESAERLRRLLGS